MLIVDLCKSVSYYAISSLIVWLSVFLWQYWLDSWVK